MLVGRVFAGGPAEMDRSCAGVQVSERSGRLYDDYARFEPAAGAAAADIDDSARALAFYEEKACRF